MIRVGTVAILISATLVLAQSPDKLPSSVVRESVDVDILKAPGKAASRNNPLENDPQAVAAGAKLFKLHCAECHGPMAQGGKKAPNLRAEPVQQASSGALFWILTNGVVRRGMPVWSKLPEPQRWQLVSYIKSLHPLPDRSAKPDADQAKSSVND